MVLLVFGVVFVVNVACLSWCIECCVFDGGCRVVFGWKWCLSRWMLFACVMVDVVFVLVDVSWCVCVYVCVRACVCVVDVL